MKTITLTQGKVALVDDEDYDFLMQWKWFAHFRAKRHWYACRNSTVSEGLPRRTIQMHVVIKGEVEGKVTDHRNGETLDNQRHNLREASYSDNASNTAKRKNSSSQYLGVQLWTDHRINKTYWVAVIRKGKVLVRKYFNNEDNAATAYNILALKHHGEFAKQNIA